MSNKKLKEKQFAQVSSHLNRFGHNDLLGKKNQGIISYCWCAKYQTQYFLAKVQFLCDFVWIPCFQWN